jgi:glycosyltransferase involved in cell wall biosynthesis
VRSILWAWLKNPPANYQIEPVYANSDHQYRYARRFTARFLGIPEDVLHDEPFDFSVGDIFLGLDLQLHSLPAQRSFYRMLRQQGVRVKFVVYDLLPNLLPQFFMPEITDMYTPWLGVVAESDGAVCISETVASELNEWVQANGPVRQRPFQVSWFHLGADIENSYSYKGLPTEAVTALDQIASRPSFLMVGTLEPRKGHARVIDAFEQLWQLGVDSILIIAGKQGWAVESLIERLRVHPERNIRLFWLEGISDEYLEKVYAASTCLIAASFGEGFGLPLIEAAQHKMPIIARDIPVFREVAGDYAFYFNSEKAEGLAQTIQEWLELYKKDNHPRSDAMPWLTWKESADQLLKLIIPNQESGSSIKKETM